MQQKMADCIIENRILFIYVFLVTLALLLKGNALNVYYSYSSISVLIMLHSITQPTKLKATHSLSTLKGIKSKP